MKTLLGQQVEFPKKLDPTLLCPIARNESQVRSHLSAGIPFDGADIWNCYELSWLNSLRVPQVAILQFTVPCCSPNLIESKSVKLFLGSINNETFDSPTHLLSLLREHLGQITGTPLSRLTLWEVEQFATLQISSLDGHCIDRLTPSPKLPLTVSAEREVIEETLFSHLLRSICPVTGQPDWASVRISYRGRRLIPESLLAYLISLREHAGFHEELCEKIFIDISEHATPKQLCIQCFFTRRGGIDINPIRFSPGFPPAEPFRRLARS